MLVISKEYVTGIMDKVVPPVAFCESGATVQFETRDCYDDSVVSEERPLGDKKNPIANPATGPLDVTLPTPFLYCRGDVMTMQSALTLDKAGDMAAKAMKEFVKQAKGVKTLACQMVGA